MIYPVKNYRERGISAAHRYLNSSRRKREKWERRVRVASSVVLALMLFLLFALSIYHLN